MLQHCLIYIYIYRFILLSYKSLFLYRDPRPLLLCGVYITLWRSQLAIKKGSGNEQKIKSHSHFLLNYLLDGKQNLK
uniref:Uncharacterized protein n=1 Tax=Anguilla anguilla TaxID=7936 RepID=A0A0E9REA0_ANGAN